MRTFCTGLRGCLAIALTATLPLGASAQNYSDIWYNPNESGWGLTIADHETQLFAVWYTYRANGQPTWYTIPGGTFSSDRRTFSGAVYSTTGPTYGGTFNSAMVTATPAGTASFDFAPTGAPAGSARFSYTVGGISGTKTIQRQPFGNAAPSWGTDHTDIWYNANESGWGMTLAQHGNNVFGVLYVYGDDGQPLFVVMPGVTFNSSSSFSGALYTTTGPYFGNATFDPNQVQATAVGNATVTIGTGGATLNATINTRPFAKNVVKQPFGNAVPANAASCRGTYSITVSTMEEGCMSYTFMGEWGTSGTNLRTAGSLAGAQVSLSYLGSRFSYYSGGYYGMDYCTPLGAGPVMATVTGGTVAGTSGSAQLNVPLGAMAESASIMFTVGASSVTGTLSAPSMTGSFSCVPSS